MSDSAIVIAARSKPLQLNDIKLNLRMLYVLQNYPFKTLREIGAEIELTSQRVRQVLYRGLKNVERLMDDSRQKRTKETPEMILSKIKEYKIDHHWMDK